MFLVEPMIAKMVLPSFGGSPAVWITAMVFFQAVLLLSYAYAHASARILGPRAQPLVHLSLLLLVVAALPVGQHLAAPPAGDSPALWLLGILAVAVGAPFFAVASASPVLQRWFASTNHASARDPYFLYVASNVGSLLGLVAYPLVVEPRLSLSDQAALWSGGYLVFAALSVACGVLAIRRSSAAEHVTAVRVGDDATARISWRVRLRWLGFAFVPVSLMLGVTSFISTDVAAVPLIWVLPLAVYLATFIVSFSRRPILSVGTAARALPLVVLALVPTLLNLVTLPIAIVIPLHLAALFLAGVVAHGRLASERPPAARLTEFYLLLSLGGVLGGVFNALLAPQLFEFVAEYPLLLIAALLLAPFAPGAREAGSSARARRLKLAAQAMAFVPIAIVAGHTAHGAGLTTGRVVAGGAVFALVGIAARRSPRTFLVAGVLGIVVASLGSGGMYAERTFFGVYRVIETKEGDHLLAHGTTLHGREGFVDGRLGPTTYYARTGPVGDVFRELQRRERFGRVSLIGLGVGTLAEYARPGQSFTFYEIDPAVVEIARDPRLFTFLSRSRADVEIVVGDGRLKLADARDRSTDLLVVDAFSSDSIPVHLLTREAVSLYFAKLEPDGVAIFNISNRQLALEPVVAAVAGDLGLSAASRLDDRVSPRERERGKTGSHWVAVARRAARLQPLVASGWKPLAASDGVRPRSDDFSNILSVIRWR
ncbi:MAG: fused MFS/spermidine synthase [Actinomycetota bacterium]|nr:fused MFS/spermidine synthase [Actinomycetota bacterium]